MPKVDSPGRSGIETSPLSDEEAAKLKAYLQRGHQDLAREGNARLAQYVQNYREIVRYVAEVAKAEFEVSFDGHQPQSGAFGVSRIRSGYLGYDSWDNCPDATQGSVTTWLDNSTPDNLSGSGGQSNPLTVGEPVVHLVTGIGSFEQNPKAEAVKFRLNDQPRTAVDLDTYFRKTDLRVAPLTTPIVLKEDDNVFAELYGGADGSESLYLDGISYIQAKDYRELDPANMAGTGSDNIVVE